MPYIRPLPGQEATQGPFDWVFGVVALVVLAAMVGLAVAFDMRQSRTGERVEPPAPKAQPPAKAA